MVFLTKILFCFHTPDRSPIFFCTQAKSIHRILLSIVLFFACCSASAKLSIQPVNTKQINKLVSKFHTLSTQIYQYYAHSKTLKFNKIDRLEKKVNEFEKQDYVSAIILIKSNLATIKDNIDDKSIFYFISLLLEHNEWGTAHELFDFIKNDGEKSLISNVNFVFAKYYLKQNKWQKSAYLLTGIFDDLTEENANYAYLINGIALQRLKKHREAIKLYKNISENSIYYSTAQLNSAIADIRQGWWTDAHLLIKNLLQNNNINKSDEITNRLYLVLGYSLLQKEYYRDAREAFRNISLKSKYSNRALLGIALTAANQEDYIGALNALSILKNKNTSELSVEESYLLIPYVYGKIQKNMTASASYSEAIEYYENKILNINNVLSNKNKLYSLSNLKKDSGHFKINGTTIDFTRSYPVYFLDNMHDIKSLIKYINKPKNKSEKQFHKKLTSLQEQYKSMLSNMLYNILIQRKEYLNSYINQSRYGLARLYDNTTIDKE